MGCVMNKLFEIKRTTINNQVYVTLIFIKDNSEVYSIPWFGESDTYLMNLASNAKGL